VTYTFTAATIAAAGNQVTVPAGAISSVDVVLDVQGSADVSNITVNGQSETPAVTAPGTKSVCKHGAWKSFGGHTFKNQGQCVSWFNHHVLNHGHGRH